MPLPMIIDKLLIQRMGKFEFPVVNRVVRHKREYSKRLLNLPHENYASVELQMMVRAKDQHIACFIWLKRPGFSGGSYL
jgi:hypothetical protein